MGMDVWGRNPREPAGRYFRANIWSWRPIQALINELCSDLLDEPTLIRLGVNVGAGPRDGSAGRRGSGWPRWSVMPGPAPGWFAAADGPQEAA